MFGGIVNVEQLENEIRQLPARERAKLYTRLGLSEGYRISKNWPKRIEDWITIDDSSAQSKERPQIKVKYRDVNNPESGEDIIDIIDSVKKDPRCIGHPFILFAILRWVTRVKWKRSLARKSAKFAEEYQIAEGHLKRIGSALLDGAKDGAVPIEFASIYVQFFGRIRSYGTLHAAWIILADPQVKKLQNTNVKIEEVRERLLSKRHPEEYVKDTMMFFKTSEGRHFFSKRRSWEATMRGYEAWAVSLTPDTYKRYFFEANKQAERVLIYPTGEEAYTVARDEFDITNISKALGDWFSLPYLHSPVDIEG
jgi:hypothetical protein